MSVLAGSRMALHEFLTLRETEREVCARTPEQNEQVRSHASAADRRLLAARDLAGVANVACAVLLKDALACALRAYAASKDATLGHERALQLDLAQVLADLTQRSADSPADWQHARDLLVTGDPLQFDALSEPKLEEARAHLEEATAFVRRQVNARTLRQVRFFRWARLMSVGAVALGFLALGIWRLLAPENLALDKPVRASSLTHADRPASALVNGSIESQWGLHTKHEASAWAIIDLERSHRVTLIKVYNRGDGWFDDCLPLVVELSEDGQNFAEVGRRTKHFDQDDPWKIKLEARPARYVRLRVARHSYLSLSEVEVYGS